MSALKFNPDLEIRCLSHQVEKLEAQNKKLIDLINSFMIELEPFIDDNEGSLAQLIDSKLRMELIRIENENQPQKGTP